jgi:D-alanine-D-alanine ligase
MALKVVVIMGGPSEEHDVSRRSGQGVLEALARRQWVAEPLVIPRTACVDEAMEHARHGLTQARADIVFIALHGPFGEDGTIQQLCEELHLPYTGSDVLASRLGMDKVASKRRFEEAGLCVPRWRVIEASTTFVSRDLEGLTYPLVVKPTRSGSSFGVSIVTKAL